MTTSRPRYHFTPPQNFMNDPNGLVYYDGEYHLFYQHNPFGDVWGHMSWGHAVSRDLVHWEHLPVAMHEDNGVMIFSGTAVVDWRNTSGFGAHGAPPMIAVYTGHSETEQTQNIACSTDRGRTWTKYAGNPVIAIGSREFRDPKVFWHAPTQRWIMVTVLSDQHRVRFDSSPDLKHWTYLSEFGPAGATDGLWECPDLFPVPIEDEPEKSKWVLKVDALRGTGAQYFIGEFDGTRFTNESPDTQTRRVDYGADFYAAQSWAEEPGGRQIWIGWMNNWHYANEIPTSPWRGLFSIPRQLSLRRVSEGLRLAQQPIEELKQLRREPFHVESKAIDEINARLTGMKLEFAYEIDTEIFPGTAAELGLRLCAGDKEETRIGYDAQAGELYIDRRQSGDNTFSEDFGGMHRAALPMQAGTIRMHIFVDSCSVELFGDRGEVVLSDLIFPRSRELSLELYAQGGEAYVQSLNIWSLGGQP